MWDEEVFLRERVFCDAVFGSLMAGKRRLRPNHKNQERFFFQFFIVWGRPALFLSFDPRVSSGQLFITLIILLNLFAIWNIVFQSRNRPMKKKKKEMKPTNKNKYCPMYKLECTFSSFQLLRNEIGFFSFSLFFSIQWKMH